MRNFLARYRYSLWLLEGAERVRGYPLSILFAGPDAIDKNYIAHMAFHDPPSERYLGRKWILNPLNYKPKDGYSPSLMIVEVPRGFISPGVEQGFFVPCWVDGRIDIQESLALAQSSSSLKSDLRKIEKNKFTYRITRDRNEYVEYYHEMYVPHIKSRFEKQGTLHSLDQILALRENSDLLLVLEDDRPIAGGLVVYRNPPLLFCIGIKKGDPAYLKKSALTAVDYFLFIYLLDKGYRYIDMGASRGFILDGVLQYKKKLGLRLTDYRDKVFFIAGSVDDAGARAFLLSNPFLSVDSDEMSSVGFAEPGAFPTAQSLQNFLKALMIPGVKRCVIQQLGEGELPSLPEGLPIEVEVRRFQDERKGHARVGPRVQ